MKADEQLKIIKRGVVDIVTEEELMKKLEKKQPLTVKLGIDPTSPDIHLGHTVTLNKLRQFQDLGHNAVLIIGDYTAMIGDPSGRMSERPQISREIIMKNVKSYEQQAFKILDKSKLKIVYNGEWFSKLNFEDVIKLISKFTIAQMFEHDYFDKRFKEGVSISLHELIYPIMQAYDSVMIKADIELGGTDQRFNVIVGRYLQKVFGQEQQVGLFTPILTGLDGKNKMSKSLKNYIGINDKPEDMFGKVMSIPDELIWQYYELLTDEDLDKIKEMEKNVKSEELNPMVAKKELAWEIVKKYHNKTDADFARNHFEKTFSEKEIPYDEYEYKWDFKDDEISIADFFKKLNAAKTNSEARRIVEQGGFYLNDERVTDFTKKIKKSELPFTFKIGKKNFGKFTN